MSVLLILQSGNYLASDYQLLPGVYNHFGPQEKIPTPKMDGQE